MRAERSRGSRDDLARRLDFLYETSRRVAGLLDEGAICTFVVDKAADLLECGRASLMLVDRDGRTLRIRASRGLPQHVAAETNVRPGERISGGVFSSGHGVVIGAEDPMPSDALGIAELEGFPSFMSVPLTIPEQHEAEQRIVGVLNLTRKSGGGAFDADDLTLVETMAAHAAAQVHNCRLLRAEQERERLAQEMRVAAGIQLSLLPEGPLRVAGLQVAGVCRSAGPVGGDFYDYWTHGDRLCAVVADVTGHDLGSALLATGLRSVLRAESGHTESVADVISVVSRAIYPDLRRSGLYVTMVYVQVDLPAARLTYCLCGHPWPLLLRDGDHRWLRAGGPLLGVFSEASHESEAVQLEPGDRLVMYTDGITEAGTWRGRPFGEEGVVSAARRASSRSAESVAVGLADAAGAHSDGETLDDDTTALVLHVV